MAKKKKKKRAPTLISYLERRLMDLERSHHQLEARTQDLETYSHQATMKAADLETVVDSLKQGLRSIRDAAQHEAELRTQAESMVMRKLIHTLLADRKGVDMFLDKLSDLAPEIAKGVLVGTFEDTQLVDGVRPNRADDTPTAV